MRTMSALIVATIVGLSGYTVGTNHGQAHPVVCHTDTQVNCLWVDGTASTR